MRAGLFHKMQDLSQRYEEETQRIELARALAWSSRPVESTFGPFRFVPLTIRAWVDLKAAQNAFICGTIPDATDIESYVWRNSKRYSAKRSLRTWLIKARIRRKVKKLDAIAMIDAIHEHLTEAFDELPETAASGYSRTNGVDAVDGTTCAIDEVASRYGRDPMEVIDWPVSRVFSMQKAMRVATIPKYKPLAPRAIREINSRILESLN